LNKKLKTKCFKYLVSMIIKVFLTRI